MLKWILTNIASYYTSSKIKVREELIDFYLKRIGKLNKHFSILNYSSIFISLSISWALDIFNIAPWTSSNLSMIFFAYGISEILGAFIILHTVTYPLIVLKVWRAENKKLNDENLIENRLDFSLRDKYEQIEIFKKRYRFTHPWRIVFLSFVSLHGKNTIFLKFLYELKQVLQFLKSLWLYWVIIISNTC
ncbi:hypothetical protein H9M94_01005 [Mycoplasma sp. Pen4]|uniref:hypothetical protein n=1 Tax=Mycoplasma sp. Pen4 TaxID=640330 RepID=UPI001654B3FC|nr:hypothetical protein [Mycoplasma sp. Pen4]QNM93837.1 hypothetical protein H9M94_01005 [Mycoplasma sp. Pen4]